MYNTENGLNNDPYKKVAPSNEAGGPHLMPQEVSPEDQYAMEMGAKAAQEEMDRKKQARESAYSALATDVEAKLNSRMGTRKSKENQWLEAMRVYLGSLSSYNIVTGDYPFGTRNDANVVHRPEFNIIRQKCNVAIAQTVTHQFAVGDKNWSLRTPQVLDIDQDDLAAMAQQTQNTGITPREAADIKTDLMEREIEYHQDLTNYAAETRKSLIDRVILGTGVMKGPVNAGKMTKKYIKSQTSDGKTIRIPTYTTEYTPLAYRVNLWYFFPDDSVTDVDQAENAIEVHPYNKQQLAELARHPGYEADQIALCLDEEPRTYTNSPFNDPAYLTQGINLLKNKYLVMEYHGQIDKEQLEILGIPTDDSPLDTQYAEVWVVNSRVIRIQTSVIEGCTHLPYYCCVWEPDPATIFGFGIPMLARDQQRVVNETYKMVLDNAGISAGPQVVVDTTLIKPADGDMGCTPFKVWYSAEYGADMTKAIQFFTPENSFQGLSDLITLARGFADEESSINLLAAGASNPAGAMDSATGMALANENAMTPLFLKSEEWDDHITRPMVQAFYDWEMQYNPKDEIKCTVDIDVRSTTAYLRGVMDQHKLDQTFQEIAQGSPTKDYINLDALMRARLTGMKLPSADIIKTPEQMAQEKQKAAQNPPPPDPNMLKAQAMMQQNQIEGQKLQLDSSRLQWEQQKHEMDTQAQMQNQHLDFAATVNTNQSKERQEVLKHVSSQAGMSHENDIAHLQMATQLATSSMAEQTKKQLGGLGHAEHVQTLQQKQRELAVKQQKDQKDQEIKIREIRANAKPHPDQTANRNVTRHNPKPKA